MNRSIPTRLRTTTGTKAPRAVSPQIRGQPPKKARKLLKRFGAADDNNFIPYTKYLTIENFTMSTLLKKTKTSQTISTAERSGFNDILYDLSHEYPTGRPSPWVFRRIHPQEESFALHSQRIQIARDLHDGIGSQLTHIVSRLEVMAHHHTDMEKVLMGLRDFTRDTIQQLRETIWVLNQEEITYGQLTERIRGLISRLSDDYESTKIQLAASGDKALEIPPPAASSLFRIIQEGINNVLKYANASEAAICLTADDHSITLQISDNGCGFDISNIKTGYGLQNMQMRAEELSGQFHIHSSDKGTNLMVCLPVISHKYVK